MSDNQSQAAAPTNSLRWELGEKSRELHQEQKRRARAEEQVVYEREQNALLRARLAEARELLGKNIQDEARKEEIQTLQKTIGIMQERMNIFNQDIANLEQRHGEDNDRVGRLQDENNALQYQIEWLQRHLTAAHNQNGNAGNGDTQN